MTTKQTTQTLIGNLKDEGARMTDVRRAVLAFFATSSKPLSAPEMLEMLHDINLSVNKTTVYRELQFLVNKNVIVELSLKQGVVHYELADLPHHHHLVCTECGDVSEVDCEEVEHGISTINKKAQKNGFVIKNHKLEFYGMCGECVVN